MSQNESAPNKLPGFGLPLNHIPKKQDADYVGPLFPNALNLKDVRRERASMPLVTLRELNMLHFMNQVTDKPDWHIKVRDRAIVKKWKEEVFSANDDFTKKMFRYCIQELRHKASLVPEPPTLPPPIIVYDANVVKSDFAVSPTVKKGLQDAMQKFEDDIPMHLRDWHPHSDEQVLDLVHPSLFPLVYGTTRILQQGVTTLDDCIRRCGEGSIASDSSVTQSEGSTVEKDDEESDSDGESYFYEEWYSEEESDSDDIDKLDKAYSKKFQWLPCEVDISGDKTRITSYINNLHPREKGIYELVEKIIDASIPLWGVTLSPLRNGQVDLDYRRVYYDDDGGAQYDPDPANAPDTEGPQQRPDESFSDYHRRRWIERTQRMVLPEPEDFVPRILPSFNLRELYGHRGLQVIVKFANIVLTPEKPEYKGGSWHVEGQLNEHIVATSLYYYSLENITASSLSFRQQVCTGDVNEGGHTQDEDHSWLSKIYGCPNYDSGVQDIGAVDTKEGRLLTFPNILQHCVQPFKLADPTKPGHRKILALFLVDPNIKVISTAHVPCQRKDWWKDAAISEQVLSPDGTGLGSLPVELQNLIFDEVQGFPLDMDEAKALRLKLMKERTSYVKAQDEAFQHNVFNLCEH
ncbi:hypothetical protein CVT24_011204 [Panaeolus cyanescens]|uniref:Uncharacterized protein n=1 Tax=Panaeolus cyanescens TaxID=181874 RepID=A0A409YGF1_9AGAR|nr:hypothetical protein CVT24_011204 [Panaeolus cyanescens]